MMNICKCSFCEYSQPTEQGGFTCLHFPCKLNSKDIENLIEKIFSKN